MPDWLAGFVAGLAMGGIFVGVEALLLPASQRELLGLVKSFPLMGRAFAWAVATMVSPFLWGGLGALLGRAYGAIHQTFPGAGLGSPNLLFTLGVSAFVAASLIASMAKPGRALWGRLVLALAFGGIFGWLLPWLAS